MLILSRKRVEHMCQMSPAAISMAVRRGRLSQVDIVVDGIVRRGITFRSLREYHGWSQATCDQILDPHGLTEEMDTLWTYGVEDSGVDGTDVLTPVGASHLFSRRIPEVLEASREGKVATPFALSFTGPMERLIDLASAVAYWGQPQNPKSFGREVERMRRNGLAVEIGDDRYRILHSYPLVVRGDAMNLAEDLEGDV